MIINKNMIVKFLKGKRITFWEKYNLLRGKKVFERNQNYFKVYVYISSTRLYGLTPNELRKLPNFEIHFHRSRIKT